MKCLLFLSLLFTMNQSFIAVFCSKWEYCLRHCPISAVCVSGKPLLLPENETESGWKLKHWSHCRADHLRKTNSGTMAHNTAPIFRKVVALTSTVCVDLSIFYASGFVVTHGVFGHLSRLWVSAALRCLALTAIALFTLGDLKPVLIRFITLHSVLPATFETGTRALYHEESQCGLLADVRCWLMCAGASLAAALFWELTIPDTNDAAAGKEKKQKARVLFMRVLRLYKPYYLMLFGGFVFLSLAVICKYSSRWRRW